MKGEASCFNTRALINYVRANSPENLSLLWTPLQGRLAEGEDPEGFLSNPKNRVSIEVCRDIMEQAKKATSDDMAVYKAALGHGRQREGGGNQQRWLRALAGPSRAIRKLQERNGKLLGGNTIEILSASDRHALIRVHWSKELPLTRDFCLFAKGIYQAIPTRFRLSPARLWERTCFFEGGPYCEYEMWWDKEPSPKISRLMPALGRGVFRSPGHQVTKGENQTAVADKGTARPHRRPSKKPVDQDRRFDPAAGLDPQGNAEALKAAQSPAGSASHELNNVFAGIQGRVSLMLLNIDARHPHFEHLKHMEGMIEHGAKLTKQLLDSASDSQDQIEAAPLNQEKATREPGWTRELMRGTETVLLVDDEDMLVDIGRQMLEALGYQVMVARNGKEAVEIYEKHHDSIDMVILDMIMPDMGGAQACDRMKEISPDIKILVASGYSIEGQARRTLARGCDGFIQKPFSLKQLSEKIRGILDSE
jgi:CheY-like chemotaxis protein